MGPKIEKTNQPKNLPKKPQQPNNQKNPNNNKKSKKGRLKKGHKNGS